MRSKKRAAAASGLVALMCLAITSSAIAWRHPSRSERTQITTAAKRTEHAGSGKVQVSNIRVSTVGPWASATLTIYFGTAPDTATDILHKVRRKWTNAGDGTAGEWCVMPRKDQRNLGFPADYPCPR
jgi:hypothetical protein